METGKKKPTCINWNPKGDLIAMNESGGNFFIFDCRKGQGAALNNPKCHDGPKAQKSVFARDDIALTTGFNRSAEREYCVWDLRSMD